MTIIFSNSLLRFQLSCLELIVRTSSMLYLHSSHCFFSIFMRSFVGVGKSAFLARWGKGVFLSCTCSTVTLDFQQKEAIVNDVPYRLQLVSKWSHVHCLFTSFINLWLCCYQWDTPGSRSWIPYIGSYCKRAKGVILQYDITSRYSLSEVKSLYEYNIRRCVHADCPLMVLGSKCDLKEKRVRGLLLSCHMKTALTVV
jgi:GTPase SAR1 family protein